MSVCLVVLNYLCCLFFASALMRRLAFVRETAYVEFFEAFFIGTLLFYVQTFFFVELLSLPSLLGTPGPLAALYAIFAFFLFVAIFRWRSRPDPRREEKNTDRPVPALKKICYFIGLLIILPLLFVAVYYPPCTADSMSYHLPRILHWIQNGNVSTYPTNYMRQIYVQPFAEYLVLPFELMTGSDYLDNVVQMVALVGILLLTALLIRHFGGGGWTQMLGVAIVLGSPLVIFEAPTTQTDLVVTFLFFGFVYSGLKLCSATENKDLWFYALCMGASLGLSLNTKLSVAPFELPFCFWFGWRFLQIHRRKAAVIYGVLLAGFLIFNVPYFVRNYQISGSPFGVKNLQLQVRNLRFGPDVIFSNAVRNVGMQMLTPILDINEVNVWFAIQCHEAFGIRWQDPETTYTGIGTVPYPYEPVFVLDDYRSGSMLIILLFSIVSFSLGGTALKRWMFPVGMQSSNREKISKSEKKKKNAESGAAGSRTTTTDEPGELFCLPNCRMRRYDLAVYAWLMFFGFLLFCCFFRWQPFGARLLLPVFLGTIPFIAIGLCRILEPKRIVQMTVLILGISLLFVIFATANSLFFNPIESLIDFEEKSAETVKKDPASETNSPASLISASEAVPVPVPKTSGTENLANVAVSIKNVELLEDYFRPDRSFVEQFRFRRNYKYFRIIKHYLIDYIAISEQIAELGVTDIGLALDPYIDRWEYPFWPILRSRNPKIRLKWVVFPDYLKKTRNYDPDFVPDVIITDYAVDVIQAKFAIEHAWKYENLVLVKIKKNGDSSMPEKDSENQPDNPETLP